MGKVILLIFAIIIAIAVTLSSCVSPKTNASDSRFDNSDVFIVTDYQTGCKYLAYSSFNQGGLTNLLNSKGKTYCRDAK